MNDSIQIQRTTETTPVLIVDDDPSMLEVMQFSLDDKKISCLTAASVDKACSLLNDKERKIALMLLDWKLDRSGMEVLRVCRALYPLMPVIVMSGVPLDVRTDAILAEADGFLQKQFSPALAVSHIERWLKRLALTSTALPQREVEIFSLEELKRIYVRHVVELLHGNVSLAAEKLGMHRHTVSAALKTADSGELHTP